jgi:hypothetical protein
MQTEEKIKTVRERKSLLSSRKIDHSLKLNFDKLKYKENLTIWAQRGFSTSKTDRAAT